METAFPTTSMGTLHGVQQVVQVANPSAGADWTYTVGQGYYWRLLSARAIFQTSATAGNRFVNARVTDGTNVLWEGAAPAAQVASGAYRMVVASVNGTLNAQTSSIPQSIAIPQFWLPPSYTFGTNTVNLLAGDQFSSIIMWWECIDRAAMHEHQRKLVAYLENSPITINEGK